MVNKKSWFERYKKYIYISTGAVMVMALSFVITLNIFSMENDMTEKIPEDKIVAQNNKKFQTDDSSIRMKENVGIRVNDDNQIDVGVDTYGDLEKKYDVENSAPDNTQKNVRADAIDSPPKSVPASTTPTKKEITFELPLEGSIIMEFAPEKLIYSETLEEWITHNGVDIKGEEAMPVKAVSDGIVKSIKVDPRYGNTIIIEHDDGYESRYSNLSTNDLVKVKQEVKKGDIISGVGKGYGFEILEGPHIHVEVLKDGKYVSILDLVK